MKTKLSILVSALFLVISFGCIEQVLACSPSPYSPPVCEMYGKSDTVFIGTILDIKEIKKVNVSSDFEITFLVEENFLGVVKNSIVTVILWGATPENYCFKKGEDYLVYARGKDKKFTIDAGTRTRHINEASEDLEFLRKLPKQKGGVRVYGNVRLQVKSSLEKDNKEPFYGAIVVATSLKNKKTSFQTTTNTNGYYEFTNLPPESYRISVKFKEKHKLYNEKYRVSISGSTETMDKGCFKREFTVEPEGTISGKVIDSDGNPVKNTEVEIISIFVLNPDYYQGSEYSDTDSKGEFVSYNVPPGLYTISVNYSDPPENDSPFPPTFYPNVKSREQAQVFEMTLGGKIENLIFQLPPRLKKRLIKGTIFWKDRTPAKGVTVHLTERKHDVCCVNKEFITNAKGQFELQGLEGREYRVWAVGKNLSTNVNDYGASEPFVLSKNTLPINIRLDKTRSWIDDMDSNKDDVSGN